MNLPTLFFNYFDYSEYPALPCEFKDQFVNCCQKKKCSQDFYRDYADSVDQFGEYCQLDNVEYCDP